MKIEKVDHDDAWRAFGAVLYRVRISGNNEEDLRNETSNKH